MFHVSQLINALILETEPLQLMAEGGQNKNLFHQAMGDSPPLIYLPQYTDAYIEDLFTQFAGLA